ncbi:MAG: 50S ribosomal protein L29 [Desulfobacteraceae bacterium]|nr:50S ribosomal protein L29 [Desulfobacteraceae bacterium]
MKAAAFRDLTIDELVSKGSELSEELARLSFQHAIRPLENTARLGQLRKDIARVKTVANQKRAAR